MPQVRNDPAAGPAEVEKPVGPRSRKGVRTRSRLLEAAKEIFEENGFLEARISDIAERAGLSHGSFYHYFESKEEIFREVAKTQEDTLSSHCIVDSGLLDTSTNTTMRERLGESNRRFLADYRQEAGIMGVIEQVSRYDDQVRAARLAQSKLYSERTEDAIRHLQRQGLADPGLDPVIAASALSAMVSRFAEMWFVQDQLDCGFDEGVEQLTSLCMNALQLKDRSASAPRGRSTHPGRH
ncbi:MAG TPA: TetR/AcrR family transcriptional regulator [Acidimicrobiales bacterium]|jgi:AcrR family transcriptional regulator|nr:TetR/AcrR family transcriptional regulator [Acidimicrobiales bacterium]